MSRLKFEECLYTQACCLRSIEGFLRILAYDYLKTFITELDRYMTELDVIMEAFANYYGFVIIPTQSWYPKDKTQVEYLVWSIHRREYIPLGTEMAHSIRELDMAIVEKMQTV